MMRPTVLAVQPTNPFTLHLWHGVEALTFLFVALGGIALAEWRQRHHRELRRDGGRPPRLSEGQSAVLLSVAGLCSVAAAAVHFVVMPDHFEESALYGAFFLVTAVVQLGYAALIVARPSRGALCAGLVANVAVIALWLTTRLVAIPLGPAAGTREEVGGLDVLASGFEVAFVAAVVVLLVAGALTATPRKVGRVLAQPWVATAALATFALIGVTAHAAPPS